MHLLPGLSSGVLSSCYVSGAVLTTARLQGVQQAGPHAGGPHLPLPRMRVGVAICSFPSSAGTVWIIHPPSYRAKRLSVNLQTRLSIQVTAG